MIGYQTFGAHKSKGKQIIKKSELKQYQMGNELETISKFAGNVKGSKQT